MKSRGRIRTVNVQGMMRKDNVLPKPTITYNTVVGERE
jgi:hypothetical protein